MLLKVNATIIENLNMSTDWYRYINFGLRWSGTDGTSTNLGNIHDILMAPHPVGQCFIQYKSHYCDPTALLYQGQYIVQGSKYVIMSASYENYSSLIFYNSEKQYWFSLLTQDVP